MAEKSPECPWCVQTNFACGIDRPDHDALSICEFRTLSKEKGAILARAKEVVADIKKNQELLKTTGLPRPDQEKAVREVLDKMFGLDKMIDCLEKEFNMKRSDALKEAGYEGSSALDKAKAVLAFKKLMRGAK